MSSAAARLGAAGEYVDYAASKGALDGYRIGADGKPEARRGGLGLPLARQLIEAHGGRLDMQSEKGAGTTATISLP